MASSSFDRGITVFLAKVADEAEDYNEVVEQMTTVATKVAVLEVEERKLLQAGYGKLITRKRDSWVTIAALETKEREEGGNEVNIARINRYKRKIEREIIHLCAEMLSLLNVYLIPSATTSDASVFYYTMKGDYYRYRAKVKYGTYRDDDGSLSLQTYGIAMGIAEAHLSRAHPIRLGLDLNVAVLYHEVLENTEKACQIGDKTFDEASPLLRELSDEDREYSNHWMHCLDKNMNMWSKLSNRSISLSSMMIRASNGFSCFPIHKTG